MGKIIREETIASARFGASSDYLLIDSTMKEMLSQELGQPFDRDKHKIKTQLSISKDNKIFVAFWFVDEKKKKDAQKAQDAKDMLGV